MKFTMLSAFLFVIFNLSFPSEQVFASQIEKNNIKDINVKMKEIFFETKEGSFTSSKPMILYKQERFLPFRETMMLANKTIKWDKASKSLQIEDSLNDKFNPKSMKSPLVDPKLSFDTSISAKGAVVIEDESNQVMFEKNGQLKLFPASTIKLMTAVIAMEKGNLEDTVTITEHINSLPNDSRVAHIRPGDRLTLKQLLYGMLLYSGNDAALAIAEHIGGSEQQFVSLMNKKAREIGAVHTHFVNPHGYHDPNQYTTPYDLALIAKEVTKHKELMKIIETPYYKAVFKNKNGESVIRHWDTTNQFKKNPQFKMKGVIGGKTGYTDASQHNLVTIAKHNGHQYISVILKGSYWNRYNDTEKLLNQAYQTRKQYDSSVERSIKVDFNVKELIYNGLPLNHQGHIFIYRNRAYISEKLANEMLRLKGIEEADNVYKLNVKSEKKAVFNQKKAIQSIVQPVFIGTSPFSMLSHALISEKIFLYSLNEFYFKNQDRTKNPFYQFDVNEITVKAKKPYLSIKQMKL